jgi:alkylhydroperoxidase family enzyme
LILYAERLTRAAGAGLRDGALDELKRHFSEDQVVELALVVSVANFTNRFNNGLRIEPDLG